MLHCNEPEDRGQIQQAQRWLVADWQVVAWLGNKIQVLEEAATTRWKHTGQEEKKQTG